MPLTQAVVETVRGQGLVREQVKRVIEFANIQAYLDEFHALDGNKVVVLRGGPADPRVVLPLLEINTAEPARDAEPLVESRPAVAKVRMDHYQVPPVKTKVAMPDVPVPEQPYSYERPMREIEQWAEKLAAARDLLVQECSALETAVDLEGPAVVQEIKRACLEGQTLGQVIRALELLGPVEIVKRAMLEAMPVVERDVLFTKHATLESLDQYDRTAGLLIDRRHPLVQRFEKYAQDVQALEVSQRAAESVQQELNRVNTVLKLAYRRLDKIAGAKTLMDVGRAVSNAVKGVSAPAGAAVHEFVGGAPGWVLGKAVEHAPLAATGGALYVGGKRLNEKRRNSPMIQKIEAQTMPWTQAYRMREAQAAQQSGGMGYY